MLQRSSRLRSSLIFRSSKLEESNSQALKSASGSDHKENPKEDEGNDLLKSSVVAQILEKRRSVREPFDWSSHKRTALDETKDPQSKETSEESLSEKTLKDSVHKEQPKPLEREQLDIAPKEKSTNSSSVESLTSTTSFLNMNDPEVRLQYFKELAAKRKAAKIPMESVSAAPDVSENLTDRNVKTPGISANLPDTTLTKKPSISITPADPVLKKQEVSAATDSINQSHTSIRKTSQSDLKQQDSKLSSDMSKSPSPVSLKEDILNQSKGSHNYNISRDKGLYSDATDTQKHELKKASSHTASIMTINEPGKSLQIDTKSSLSLNQTDSSVDGKAREVMKDPTQKLVSPFGTKDKTVAAREAEDISAKAGSQSNTEAGQTLKAGTSHSKEEKDDQRSSTSKVGQSRYQASTSSLIYSSNLRDDTKVILEQISASNQSRMEQAKKAVSSTDEDKMGESDKNVDTRPNPYLAKSRFQRTPLPNPQDRDVLLKKMENMRKEKKVYSRFEMGS
ncbi:hypothetical protein AGOR_G00113830 [Albula goreensis]|uniref:Uncharacterized protein n=1 Tax=Albula goreensis TaxID=1534307 RepID=A0A8T3DIT8_9TELE|nr:hypothetical protein AGOR_G00113830 [Albula goreensis]